LRRLGEKPLHARQAAIRVHMRAGKVYARVLDARDETEVLRIGQMEKRPCNENFKLKRVVQLGVS
jgi:hypothetical protein